MPVRNADRTVHIDTIAALATHNRASASQTRRSWSCLATAEAVRQLLLDLREELGTHLDQAVVHNAEIVLGEALINIVKHAYGGRPPGPIRVDALFCEDELWLQILDQGAPMPNGEAPSGLEQSLDGPVADLPTGGFGWFMIRSLTDNLHYARVDGENRLGFRVLDIDP